MWKCCGHGIRGELSFQVLNRFNFSWLLTESPGEKHGIGFSSTLQRWDAFPQFPSARMGTSHSPTALGSLGPEAAPGVCCSLALTNHRPSLL